MTKFDMFAQLNFDLVFSTEDGEPVPGVEVSLRIGVEGEQEGQLYRVGVSDEEGRFRERVPWGWEQVNDPTIAKTALILSATKSGYDDVRRRIPFTTLTKVGGFYEISWAVAMRTESFSNQER